MRNILGSLAAVFIFALTVPAHAGYYSVLDNGEILQSGHYKLLGDAQVLTRNGGLNLGAGFELGFSEDFGAKASVGFGKTDFFGAAFVKWMPIPDIENQPAVGANVGIVYGKDNDFSDMTIMVQPMMSKKVTIEQTVFTPYVSLPVGIRIRDTDKYYVDDDTKMTFQLVLGSQLQVPAWKNLQFIGEIGLDLDNAPGYIAAGAVMYFDNEGGFSLQ